MPKAILPGEMLLNVIFSLRANQRDGNNLILRDWHTRIKWSICRYSLGWLWPSLNWYFFRAHYVQENRHAAVGISFQCVFGTEFVVADWIIDEISLALVDGIDIGSNERL